MGIQKEFITFDYVFTLFCSYITRPWKNFCIWWLLFFKITTSINTTTVVSITIIIIIFTITIFYCVRNAVLSFLKEVAKKIEAYACPDSVCNKRGKYYIITLIKLSVNANDMYPKIVIHSIDKRDASERRVCGFIRLTRLSVPRIQRPCLLCLSLYTHYHMQHWALARAP